MDHSHKRLIQVMLLVLCVPCFADACNALGEDGDCTCDGWWCHGLATEVNVSTIQKIFQNLSVGPVESVEITIITDSALPAHFTGNNQVKRMSLQCNSVDQEFHVDPEAFADPTDYTRDFSIYWCQLTDLAFLKRMKALNLIHLNHVVPVSSPINRSLDFESSLRGKNLRNFTCIHCGIDTFPAVLSTMNNLSTIDLGKNPIRSLTAGSVVISSKLSVLNFTNCPIATVEQNAFKGDFSNAIIDLSHTKLKGLPKESFKYLLTQMLQPHGSGSLLLYGVNLECDCSLAWLFRKGNFLPLIKGPRCNRGDSLEHFMEFNSRFLMAC